VNGCIITQTHVPINAHAHAHKHKCTHIQSRVLLVVCRHHKCKYTMIHSYMQSFCSKNKFCW